eukprot:1456152-Pleurochrysis_carterae.AAC.1
MAGRLSAAPSPSALASGAKAACLSSLWCLRTARRTKSRRAPRASGTRRASRSGLPAEAAACAVRRLAACRASAHARATRRRGAPAPSRCTAAQCRRTAASAAAERPLTARSGAAWRRSPQSCPTVTAAVKERRPRRARRSSAPAAQTRPPFDPAPAPPLSPQRARRRAAPFAPLRRRAAQSRAGQSQREARLAQASRTPPMAGHRRLALAVSQCCPCPPVAMLQPPAQLQPLVPSHLAAQSCQYRKRQHSLGCSRRQRARGKRARSAHHGACYLCLPRPSHRARARGRAHSRHPEQLPAHFLILCRRKDSLAEEWLQ